MKTLLLCVALLIWILMAIRLVQMGKLIFLMPSDDDHAMERQTEDMIREAESAVDGAFTIHRPLNGCPSGRTMVADLFTEKDGSKRAGCVLVKSRNGDGRVDYLLPGESIGLSIEIPLPDLERKR
jgi:hypothetical protein